MSGAFNCQELKASLAKIHDALVGELKEWEVLSKEWVAKEKSSAHFLHSQFLQLNNRGGIDGISLELANPNNPFVWHGTLFGFPLSNYEGGIFKFAMYFHDEFPEVSPRIQITTPMFHVQINEDGFAYYRISRMDSVEEHLIALQSLLKTDSIETNPHFHINQKAAKLYFSNRKEYYRKVRRVTAESVEFL